MTAEEVISAAHATGAKLRIVQGQVYIRPASALPEVLRVELRMQNQAIVTELKSRESLKPPYAVLVYTSYLDEPVWIASDERALVTNEVVGSGYIAILAYEVLLLGHPARIRELVMSKRVFGPKAQATNAPL